MLVALAIASGTSWRGIARAAPAVEGRELRAAVLPPHIEGELPESDAQTLTTALVEGLQRGRFVVSPPDTVLERAPKAERCDEPKCFVQIARATQATHLVDLSVTAQDRDYEVRVRLIDGATGKVIATSAEGCEICGIADVGTLVETGAATLRTKLDALAEGPSVLTVESDPADAEVTIDGEVVGTTPLERPVLPGKRVLRVSKDGYITVEREVTVVEGVSDSLRFELEKVPSRLPARPWGWASLAVGLAGVGTSVAFAVLDDRPYEFSDACAGDNVDLDGDCRRLWDTEYIVLGTALAGAALTTLGIAILLQKRPGKRKSDRSAHRPDIGIGFGSITVRGRF